MPRDGSEILVSTKVEEAFIFRMKQAAMQKCKQQAKAYAECCKSRSISIAWACRQQFGELNSCVALHTGEPTLNELKARWIHAGRPELPDWDALFEGL